MIFDNNPCPTCNPRVQILVAYCDGDCLNGTPTKHCEVRKDYVAPERLDEHLRDLLGYSWHILSVEQRPR